MKHGEARFLSCMYVLSLTLLAIYAIRGLTGAVAASAPPERLLILDAGHGGMDGGSVSPGGTEEADINLAITLRAETLLGFLGERTLLTRTSQSDLSAEDAVTISQKKVSDIRNRVALVNNHSNAILISIHQNTYPDPSCRGPQVFYGKKQGSQTLAELIRENFHTALVPDSHRAAKPIPVDVYLMNHITVPGVLVECGFLTNPEEEKKLTTEEYQIRVALVLAGSAANYQSEEESGV